jgi:ATPase subunit of ABC transporter with duplicated ATPase domains
MPKRKHIIESSHDTSLDESPQKIKNKKEPKRVKKQQQSSSIAAVSSSVTTVDESDPAIVAKDLSFSYGTGSEVFSNISLTLPKSSRCVLIGANGTGKT